MSNTSYADILPADSWNIFVQKLHSQGPGPRKTSSARQHKAMEERTQCRCHTSITILTAFSRTSLSLYRSF